MRKKWPSAEQSIYVCVSECGFRKNRRTTFICFIWRNIERADNNKEMQRNGQTISWIFFLVFFCEAKANIFNGELVTSMFVWMFECFRAHNAIQYHGIPWRGDGRQAGSQVGREEMVSYLCYFYSICWSISLSIYRSLECIYFFFVESLPSINGQK